MKREWKPGDVAMVNDCTRPDAPWQAATCVAARTPSRETTWRLHRNGGEVWGSVSEARPLAVIDPEDREQVERLRDLMDAAYYEQSEGDRDFPALFTGARGNAMQAALREFANPTPPKPDEPTGLGAVVEDAEGRLFVRAGRDADFPWLKATDVYRANAYHWTEEGGLDGSYAVRVLSEGVTP